MKEVTFKGTDLFVIPFRTNSDSFRVTIDIGINEYDNVKDIPLLPKGVYKITITPEGEQND